MQAELTGLKQAMQDYQQEFESQRQGYISQLKTANNTQDTLK